MFVWQNDTAFIFLRLSKVLSMLYHGTVIYLLGPFLLFFVTEFVFLSLFSFFSKSIKFPQRNINQSDLGISGPKLLVQLNIRIVLSFKILRDWMASLNYYQILVGPWTHSDFGTSYFTYTTSDLLSFTT